MKKKTTVEEAQIVANEISERLVEINTDLLICEIQEQYEQAAFIQTALDLFINNSANLIATMTGGSMKTIFDGLQANSKLIFAAMKEDHLKHSS